MRFKRAIPTKNVILESFSKLSFQTALLVSESK